MVQFEVGKTYETYSGRAVATVLKRTAKTLLVQWQNGFFGGKKRVYFPAFDDDDDCEYFVVRNYKSKYHFFADNLTTRRGYNGIPLT